MKWDDWRVLGEIPAISSDDTAALKDRSHYRLLHETPEVPLTADSELFNAVAGALIHNKIRFAQREAAKSWYKFDSPGNEIFVSASSGVAEGRAIPLSERSSVVKGLAPVRQARLYVPIQIRDEAAKIANSVRSKGVLA